MKRRNQIAGGLTLGLVIVAVIYLISGGSSSDGLNLAIGTEPFDSMPAAKVKGIMIRTGPNVNVTGANRAPFTSYANYVVAVYRGTWGPLIPANLARAREAKVSVTIARDGRVLSARIINRTGDAALDRSVQLALDRVRTIDESFPTGSDDPQHTFTLDFTPPKSITLRQVDGEWRVQESGDYPADKSMVDGFILNFQNMKVLRSISATKWQLPTLNLLPPTNQTATSETAVRVEFQDDQGKRIHSALLGKITSGPPPPIPTSVPLTDRRFLMIDDDPVSIIVVDQTFSTAETNPQDWLNKDFFKIENPTSIAVTFPGGSTNSWRITEQDNNGTMEWNLADANASVKLDLSSAPTTAFSSPSFEDVATPVQATPLDTNATRIEIATRDGFQYSIRVKILGETKGYLLKMDVNATFAAQRVPAKDEQPGDKAALDASWSQQQKELKNKLGEQKKFSSRVYQVPAHVVSNVIKKRAELIATDQPPPFNPIPGGPRGPLPPLNFPNIPPKPDN